MLETILSLIGGLKGAIFGALGLLGSLWVMWTKRQNTKLRQENDQHRQAERVYKAKDQARQHDITEDYNWKQHLITVKGRVDGARDDKEAAGEISGELNNYFNGDKK